MGDASRTQAMVGVTIAPLGNPQRAFAMLRSMGARGAQLSATQPGMRPRELGASARRDLVATLVRSELVASGIDAWIPPAHFLDPAHADRAIDAAVAACELAGELGRAPVTLELPEVPDLDAPARARRAEAVAAIAAAADRHGVRIADAGGGTNVPWPPVGASVDTAGSLAQGVDPAGELARIGARCVSVRISDLSRTGMRMPPGEPGGRLDLLALRVAIELMGAPGLPIIDARQWIEPADAVGRALSAWGSAVPGAPIH
jgi:sugar phosphate isomerase/epimerase